MDKPKILIVDDMKTNRLLLASILQEETGYEISLANDGFAVLDAIEKNVPDLVLLDIMMPGMDGYEVARILKSRERTRDIPILFITAITDITGITTAFEVGGVDYITKPFNKVELLARINAHLKLKLTQDELKHKNKLLQDSELHLTELVEEKTKKLGNLTLSLVTTLENANRFNDDDTGLHIKRVSEYCAFFAGKHGCDLDFIKRIKLYASLHDVGKVGIPDALLKKPGKYTDEEFLAMQDHVVIGARMLDDPEIDRMAWNIAYYHHEKWDGSGYVSKLSGKDIPLEARIVAISDVYDALGSKRVYKEPFPEEKIDDLILKQSGRHFDPDLVDIYMKNKNTILEIKTRIVG